MRFDVTGDPTGQKETRATYEVIAAAYAARQDQLSAGGGWLTSLLDEVASRLRPGTVVVDLGCGPGLHVAYLRSLGLAAFGLDLSSAMLEQACTGAPGLHSRLVAGRVEQLPLRDSCVGGLWSSFALLHVPIDSLAGVFSEVARVLAPGAIAGLTFAGGNQPYREEVAYHDRVFRTFHPVTPEQVARLVNGAGLSIDTQGADPAGHRAAHHVRLSKPAPTPVAGLRRH